MSKHPIGDVPTRHVSCKPPQLPGSCLPKYNLHGSRNRNCSIRVKGSQQIIKSSYIPQDPAILFRVGVVQHVISPVEEKRPGHRLILGKVRGRCCRLATDSSTAPVNILGRYLGRVHSECCLDLVWVENKIEGVDDPARESPRNIPHYAHSQRRPRSITPISTGVSRGIRSSPVIYPRPCGHAVG